MCDILPRNYNIAVLHSTTSTTINDRSVLIVRHLLPNAVLSRMCMISDAMLVITLGRYRSWPVATVGNPERVPADNEPAVGAGAGVAVGISVARRCEREMKHT